MEAHSCPECEKNNHPRAVVNLIREFRCTDCGLVYYTPENCRTSPRDKGNHAWTQQPEKMRLPSGRN